GDIKLSPSGVPDHRSCRFGKWYFGEGRQMCGALPGYKAIDGPHQRIHDLAKEAVAAYNDGDTRKAEDAYNRMEAVSHEIGGLLDEIKSGLKN
ncbi:MAG: CZB domain-containing protein, partial [Nitrospiraceae bacterium]|nr:CZB domain-containing protein [Nitrospiraceae bacterium]